MPILRVHAKTPSVANVNQTLAVADTGVTPVVETPSREVCETRIDPVGLGDLDCGVLGEREVEVVRRRDVDRPGTTFREL